MKKYVYDEWIAVIVFAVMLTITFTNVLSRYCLHMSLSFTDEIVSTLFVLLATSGGAVSAKDEAHFTLNLLTAKLPPKIQQKLLAIDALLSMGVCIILITTGIQMVMSQFKMGSVSVAMRVPEWIYGSLVPIGAFLMLIRFTQVFVRKIRYKEEDQK